jgi:queuine tRNA-ribosyltransferase
MPVGTQATVKAQLTSMLEDTGSQILLANTYHLLLRPGPEIFEKMGGIHPFMSWKKSVLTDSGGFQIFSLPNSRQMSEEGAEFESYVDGRKILLSPEKSIATQKSIGSDIMMALDQCIPSIASREQARAALDITHRWARRSLDARGDSPQSLFGIVQGALFHDLRKESAETLAAMPFDGFAIGGLAVGESKAEREDTCEYTTSLMPQDRPRYLMGVGTPLDLLEGVHRGVDMFDCVLPTKLGGRGGAYTSRGHVNLRRGIYRTMDAPLDANCACLTCSRYSRAYLAHLTRTQEVLGWTLIGHHNIHFYHQLMREIRASILEGRFMELYRQKREYLQADDLDYPITGPKINHAKRRKEPSRVLGAYEVILSSERAAEVAAQPWNTGTLSEGLALKLADAAKKPVHASLRHRDSQEIMHSRSAPEEEAKRLYVDQSRLHERLHTDDPELLKQPLVIWDVGLGGAANAMGAVRCYEEQFVAASAQGRAVRPLHIVSFENDMDSLRLAILHSDKFTYLRHNAPTAILEKGRWESKTHLGLSWELIQGDFLELIGSEREISAPDFIYYDLYSFKTIADAWTRETFARLHARCRTKACELFTYTTSTAARVALLAAGFYVAKGLSTGEKVETTVALTVPPGSAIPTHRELLGHEWLSRWNRSHVKYPPSVTQAEQPGFEKLISGHEQFRDCVLG